MNKVLIHWLCWFRAQWAVGLSPRSLSASFDLLFYWPPLAQRDACPLHIQRATYNNNIFWYRVTHLIYVIKKKCYEGRHWCAYWWSSPFTIIMLRFYYLYLISIVSTWKLRSTIHLWTFMTFKLSKTVQIDQLNRGNWKLILKSMQAGRLKQSKLALVVRKSCNIYWLSRVLNKDRK